MPKLLTLLPAHLHAQFQGPDVDIEGLCFDSRKAGKGKLFFAIPGTQNDGHDYIPQVLAQGCQALVLQKPIPDLPEGVAWVLVPDSAQVLADVAHTFYGQPSHHLHLIGVTGTNGKTTTATLLFHLFRAMGHRCGLISTVQNQIEERVIPSTHTTPDALQLNALLQEMQQAGCTHVFMEVSSHAVVQQRIHGLRFKGALFSNITRDHLDFHQTFDAYIKAKKGFFDGLAKGSFALVNVDDKRGMVMVQNTAAQVHTYGLSHAADFKGKVIANDLSGLELDLDGHRLHARLIGHFNAYNLLAIYATARLMGEDLNETLLHLSNLRTAPGRFEQFMGKDKKMAIVDYAHTPDALENVLKTMQAIRKPGQRIISVFGCGGNRDRGKRPIMAAIAAKYSDFVVLTSDNPRKEDPEAILDEMLEGIPDAYALQCLRQVDRRLAIRHAIQHIAGPGDLVLVAGKGHETYQEIQGEKQHFDDMEEVRLALA